METRSCMQAAFQRDASAVAFHLRSAFATISLQSFSRIAIWIQFRSITGLPHSHRGPRHIYATWVRWHLSLRQFLHREKRQEGRQWRSAWLCDPVNPITHVCVLCCDTIFWMRRPIFIRGSVRLSVRPSFRPSVRNQLFSKSENEGYSTQQSFGVHRLNIVR